MLLGTGMALYWTGAVHRLDRWVRGADFASYPSLVPEIRQPVAVRFDPSFHYNGQRPPRLARELAEQWQAAGVNLVFYRAYDPGHGAFFTTSYDLNEMDDFGKFDLLKYVLEECHARGIRVFAWMPVLNHAGAWQAHEDWREKAVDGGDFTDESSGLLFPLCARNPEAVRWWHGFLRDFLKSYPAIDGVDLGEPVVSWEPDQACHCRYCRAALERAGATLPRGEIRAQGLTALLDSSTRIVHQAGKPVSVTSVQSALPDGSLLDPGAFRDRTGFDLMAVLHAPAEGAPDIFCPEFIWQEWKSHYNNGTDDSPFTPAWTQSAMRQFLAWVDTPVQVVAHVEISDFTGVEPTAEDLSAAIGGVIQGGSQGFDVYSSFLLDKKNAWRAIAENRVAHRRKACLVLHDNLDQPNDAIQTGELLRHFDADVKLMPLAQYTTGTLDLYDNVFYVGTESDQPLPAAFLADLGHHASTVCWLGTNIDQALTAGPLRQALGLDYVGAEEDVFHSVRYKDMDFTKEDPWTYVVKVTDLERCRQLATTVDESGRSVPYALRSGRRFWYFADVTSSFAIEGGRFLVFADLLHDIMNEDHQPGSLAMVRIEDVHPLSDPKALCQIADFLYAQDVPFQVGLVPNYVYPEQNEYVHLSDRPELAAAIRYMVKRGGTVVMHGTTHQRFGETTSDYEFWDIVDDCPPEGENEQSIRARIESGLGDLWAQGIYPLMWETPHYAGSQQFYQVVSGIFSIAMERRQAVDRQGTDQYLPYLVASDRFGQVIVPENLGYVPLADQHASVILDPARKMRTVRDGVSSFFFHPFVDPNVLREIVRTMKSEGFVFTNASGLPLRVECSLGQVRGDSGRIELSPSVARGEAFELDYPGIARGKRAITAGRDGRYVADVQVEPGRIRADLFLDPFANGSLRKPAEDRATLEKVEKLQYVPNYAGELCRAAQPLLLVNRAGQEADGDEWLAWQGIFRLVGLAPRIVDVVDFAHIPEGTNLVLVPGAAARMLDDTQVDLLDDALGSGGIALATSGFSPLSDQIGIEPTGEPMDVQEARDTYYPGVGIRWSLPARTRAFEAPGDADFIYEDPASGTPLVAASPREKGHFLFLSTPLDAPGASGVGRYPFLLSQAFRHLGVFPAVRRAGTEVYYNPAERSEDVSVEDLIKHWRRSGVRVIHVAAWQVFPEWTYDYARLIELAHNNAMAVYAWFEFPYVHEKFWLDHPEWRERNALGEEAVVDWRKPMAMGDPECLAAVRGELVRMLDAYDWDGAVIHRSGWESEAGAADPASYTPFDAVMRNKFQTVAGIDPLDLFRDGAGLDTARRTPYLERFEAFRADEARAWLGALLEDIGKWRNRHHGDREIILNDDEGRIFNGLRREDYVGLKSKLGPLGLTLQLARPMDRQWEEPDPDFDIVELAIAGTEDGQRFHPQAPTEYPSGLALYRLLGNFIEKGRRFSLMSENSLYEVDMQMMPFLMAMGCRHHWTYGGVIVQASASGEIYFAGRDNETVDVDGRPLGTYDRNHLMLPVGQHVIAPSGSVSAAAGGLLSQTRIVDMDADLIENKVTSRGIHLQYDSPRRTHLVLSQAPLSVEVDGKRIQMETAQGDRGWSVALPGGRHSARILTRGFTSLALVWTSLILSNAIVLASLVAIAGLALIFMISHMRKRLGRKARR